MCPNGFQAFVGSSSAECSVMAVPIAFVRKMGRDIYPLSMLVECDAACFVVITGPSGNIQCDLLPFLRIS